MNQVGVFYREDLSHPENRVNVALFGALGIDQYRWAALEALSLPRDAVVFPPVNTVGAGGSIRPDFCVQSGGVTIAWIEVELGADHAQLARYAAELSEPVRVIWGSESAESPLSLRNLGDLAKSLSSIVNPQQSIQLHHLSSLIDESLSGRAAQRRTAVSDEMRESAFFAQLEAIAGPFKPVNSGGSPSGFIYTDTVSSKGFSMRVMSPNSRSAGGTVSVMNRSAGRPYLQFSSRSHLREYLPHKHGEIDELSDFLAQFGLALDSDMRRLHRLALEVAENEVEHLARFLIGLAR